MNNSSDDNGTDSAEETFHTINFVDNMSFEQKAIRDEASKITKNQFKGEQK